MSRHTSGSLSSYHDFRPLLDRIDIHIEVPAVKYKELRAPSSAEDSTKVRDRVMEARKAVRYAAEKGTYANAQMAPKLLRYRP